MATDDLATLCRSCGMCCDGSLFGRVGLEVEEVEVARKRLRVLENGRGFEQPCHALVALEGERGRRVCSMYADRPRACRRFACRLYERHEREGGPLEARLTAVRRVREIVACLEASGVTPQDFERYEPTLAAELIRLLEEDFARA
jgi:Fe-S-cluster containining protein